MTIGCDYSADDKKYYALQYVDHIINKILEEAQKAASLSEVPVGALIVHEGQIIARNHNRREIDHDPTAHAEILVLQEAAKELGRWRLSDCTLYVTLEPCPMCAGALVMSRLGRLVYGSPDFRAGAVESLFNIPTHKDLNHQVEVTAGIEEMACRQILQDFFQKKRSI